MVDRKTGIDDFDFPGFPDAVMDPAYSYVILQGGSRNDRVRLREEIGKRGIPILEDRYIKLPGTGNREALVLKLPGDSRSGLMLELAEEGIAGTLTAYGKGL